MTNYGETLTRPEIVKALTVCRDECHIDCAVCPLYNWVGNEYKVDCRRHLMKLASAAITNTLIDALICHDEEVKADEAP